MVHGHGVAEARLTLGSDPIPAGARLPAKSARRDPCQTSGMARPPRTFTPHCPVHVVNRGVERRRLFDRPRDYDEFLGLIDHALTRRPARLLAYALMPNHWHLVLWPDATRGPSQFLHYLTTLHAAHFRQATGTRGDGHVYQGRFHSTSIGSDAQYLHTLRYVEANPVRARFVGNAEDWPWTSLAERRGDAQRIVPGPVSLPGADIWTALVNATGIDATADHAVCPAFEMPQESGPSQNGV